MFPTTCVRNSAELLLEHGIGGDVAERGTVVFSDCCRSGLVMGGPLMSGVEVTTCACRSCRGFFTLEHDGQSTNHVLRWCARAVPGRSR